MKIHNPSLKKSEDEWISLIKRTFPSSNKIIGIGDDCAIIKNTGKFCITTDTLIEGIDFELKWAPIEAVGWKALAQNISDLAAMGAKPLYFLLNLAIPKKCPDKEIEKLLKGILALSKKEKIKLIGGDLSKSPDKLVISITAFGVLDKKPLLRNKAKKGDYIFVSSPLGAPDEALKLFKKGAVLEEFPLSNKIKKENQLLDRFFRAPSQTRLGMILSKKSISFCSIDISDGLLKDLSRILKESEAGAVVDTDLIPKFAFGDGKETSLESALTGGEEQTLLFTVSPEKERLLKANKIKAFKVGKIISEKTIFLKSGRKMRKANAMGFDHFSK